MDVSDAGRPAAAPRQLVRCIMVGEGQRGKAAPNGGQISQYIPLLFSSLLSVSLARHHRGGRYSCPRALSVSPSVSLLRVDNKPIPVHHTLFYHITMYLWSELVPYFWHHTCSMVSSTVHTLRVITSDLEEMENWCGQGWEFFQGGFSIMNIITASRIIKIS